MKTVFKNLECDSKQLTITYMLIDNFIKEQKEKIEEYREKLNCPDIIEEVNIYQAIIKDKRENIKSVIALQKQIDNNELITKHTL